MPAAVSRILSILATSFFTIALTSALPAESRATTLGELATSGGTVESLDGKLRFSGWNVAPGQYLFDYSEIVVTPTQNGFSLDSGIGCIIDLVGGGCVLEQFDGSFGPPSDELLIDFTIEGLSEDVIAVALEGTSVFEEIETEFAGIPIYVTEENRATAMLDLGIDSLLYDRSCIVPGCGGVDPFSLTAEFGGTAALTAQLVAQVTSVFYVDEPGGDMCVEGGCFGGAAQITALSVSAFVVPEPSTALLMALGLAGLGARLPRRYQGPRSS